MWNKNFIQALSCKILYDWRHTSYMQIITFQKILQHSFVSPANFSHQFHDYLNYLATYALETRWCLQFFECLTSHCKWTLMHSVFTTQPIFSLHWRLNSSVFLALSIAAVKSCKLFPNVFWIDICCTGYSHSVVQLVVRSQKLTKEGKKQKGRSSREVSMKAMQ